MILQKLKTDAEAYLGETLKQAVITVLLTSTMHRGRLQRRRSNCRLDVLRIINEPTAAAHAYGLDKGEYRPEDPRL
jgi:molecular chaperone DnaK